MGVTPIHENKKKKFVAALDQKLTTFRFELHNYLWEWEGHWVGISNPSIWKLNHQNLKTNHLIKWNVAWHVWTDARIRERTTAGPARRLGHHAHANAKRTIPYRIVIVISSKGTLRSESSHMHLLEKFWWPTLTCQRVTKVFTLVPGKHIGKTWSI
jgi:hypothetical protein